MADSESATPHAGRPRPRTVFSMTSSADGYVMDRDGNFEFTTPTPELFDFHVELVGELAAYFLGRRLYEAMRVWETDPDMRATPSHAKFADIWMALPKVVFSTSLDRVEGNARLARGTIAEELDEAPEGIVSVGGADLAAQAIRLDLIDEFHWFVAPKLLGGGTPYFPELPAPLDLELREQRDFSGTTFLRLGRVR